MTTLALIASLLVGTVVAAPTITGAAPGDITVIDDFNDGDAGDWGFFGGNAAGGGGDALSDRPQEGDSYLSTGWGGQGSASGFYGGAFKNFPDNGQVTPPTVDPYFNVWVLNQSDATVDGYTLELTIREDLDGNGWTNGAEDSFRLDTAFTSSSFDDQWTLVSAPLNSMINLGTGGDGTFNGALDEVVIVIAGVTGANPSVVEVDFDQFSFSEGPLIGPGPSTTIDDFESGVAPGTPCAPAVPPLNFCTFNGAGSSVSLANPATPPAPALPAVGAPNSVLQMDVDSTSFAGYIHAFENRRSTLGHPGLVDQRGHLVLDVRKQHGHPDVHRHPRQPQPRFDHRRRGTVDRRLRRRLQRLAAARVPVRLVRPQGDRQRRPQRRPRPVRDARLRLGTLGTGGPQTYYFDEVASTASQSRPRWRSTSPSRTPSSTRARPATSVSSSTARWVPTIRPR